jgi:hypothetical protein
VALLRDKPESSQSTSACDSPSTEGPEESPFFIHFVSDGLGIPAWLGDIDNDERDVILLGYGGRLPAADL